MTVAFVLAMQDARLYARRAINPLTGDDPDDIAEAWNGVRDLFDQQSGGELTARQLDLVADEVLDYWRTHR